MTNSKYAKRHYEDMARILSAARAKSSSTQTMPELINGRDEGVYLMALRDMEQELIRLFKGDNGRFDEGRFLRASRSPCIQTVVRPDKLITIPKPLISDMEAKTRFPTMFEQEGVN